MIMYCSGISVINKTVSQTERQTILNAIVYWPISCALYVFMCESVYGYVCFCICMPHLKMGAQNKSEFKNSIQKHKTEVLTPLGPPIK